MSVNVSSGQLPVYGSLSSMSFIPTGAVKAQTLLCSSVVSVTRASRRLFRSWGLRPRWPRVVRPMIVAAPSRTSRHGCSVRPLPRKAAAIGRGLLRRARTAPPEPLSDVRSLLNITDPAHIIEGQLEQRLLHWPVPAEVHAVTQLLNRLDRIVSTEPERPADAPPRTLVIRMEPEAPLTCTSEGWWDRPAWLEHQVDLACSIAAALACLA